MPTEPPNRTRRTVVVTGAASGMGQAVADRFLAEGWAVVGVDRDTDAIARAAAPHGPAYRPVPVDITDRTALAAALGTLPSGLRAVVNAAGIYPTTTLASYDAATSALFVACGVELGECLIGNRDTHDGAGAG